MSVDLKISDSVRPKSARDGPGCNGRLLPPLLPNNMPNTTARLYGAARFEFAGKLTTLAGAVLASASGCVLERPIRSISRRSSLISTQPSRLIGSGRRPVAERVETVRLGLGLSSTATGFYAAARRAKLLRSTCRSGLALWRTKPSGFVGRGPVQALVGWYLDRHSVTSSR